MRTTARIEEELHLSYPLNLRYAHTEQSTDLERSYNHYPTWMSPKRADAKTMNERIRSKRLGKREVRRDDRVCAKKRRARVQLGRKDGESMLERGVEQYKKGCPHVGCRSPYLGGINCLPHVFAIRWERGMAALG